MIVAHVAYGAVTVVYPTGVNATDIQNVQAAINQGGNVLLKATNISGHPQSFNFGTFPSGTGSILPNSQVVINTNVTISGEQVGPNRTTIAGGIAPIYETNSTVKATITGLKFVNPVCDAINIWGSAGITISNNEVSGVVPYFHGNGAYLETLGIFVGSYPFNQSITGPVVISGNYVHGLGDAANEEGILTYGVESPITVTNNSVVVGYGTAAGDGSYDSEGISDYYSSGAATISGNSVTVGPGVVYSGILAHGPATGARTIVANEVSIDSNAFCYNGIGINGSTGTVNILGNLIYSQSEQADGIALQGSSNLGAVTGATVALNGIQIENSEYGALALYGAVSKSSVSLNLISGNAAYALSASSDGNSSDICSSNSFLSNLIIGFSATDATVFLDTNTTNNFVYGPYSTAINNGTGNTLIK